MVQQGWDKSVSVRMFEDPNNHSPRNFTEPKFPKFQIWPHQNVHTLLAGRGDYVRLILSYPGLSWSEKNDPAEVMGFTKKSPGGPGIFPFYAPPVLIDNEAKAAISQTHAIQHFLARKHGLLPGSETDIAAAELVFSAEAALSACIF